MAPGRPPLLLPRAGWALALGALILLLGATAIPVAADHPADRVILVVLDGPRHDLAHDPDGPLAPLYGMGNATVAENAWTAGRPKTLPGHAALLTGSRDDISNTGLEPPGHPLIWEVLNQTHGWGREEMRFVHQNWRLWLLAPDELVDEQRLPRSALDTELVDALGTNLDDPAARLVVVNFLRPDSTGHDLDWPAHEASLATIAHNLAPRLEQEADRGALVLVTADHSRGCQDPSGHGGWGPFPDADACDTHVPLIALGWHVQPGARVGDCMTLADVTALVAHALDANLTDAQGQVPTALLDLREEAPFVSQGCPVAIERFPQLPVIFALVLTVTGAGARRMRR